MAGLKELNFGSEFIKFIKLAYSHEHPPTRQIYINGYLGPDFNLASGVAQGCPISPLLFLIITEPLTRLINSHKNIQGITIGKFAHKISQYADDTVFLMRKTDVLTVLATLKIWERATAMKENEDKRDILPLGALAGHPEKCPPAILKHGNICAPANS